MSALSFGRGVCLAASLSFFAGTAFAAPATKLDVCHGTGDGGVHIVNVSENALPAHLGHGDSLVDAAETCDDGVDNDCNGLVDDGCEPGCGPLLDAFYDDFDRADGAIGPDWTGIPALVPEAFISNGEACGTEQSLALLDHCLIDVESTTISFDWRPDSDEAKEAWVTVAAETDPASGVYILGCDGGYSNASGTGQACGLDIIDVFGTDVATGGIFDLAVGATYHLEATITAAGALSVTLSDASGVIGTTSGSVAGGVDVNAVGFIVGRDTSSTTCADNFDFVAN